MKKILILFLLIFVSTSLSIAQVCSDFTLLDLEDNDVTLSELLQNGPVMMSFWALWCKPCKEEMKHMNDIYNKYKDQGFEYLAINQDDQKSIAKVKSYISAKGYDFKVLLDTDMKVFEAYNGQALPYSLLIGTNEEILAVHTGYVLGDEVKIEEEIIEALKKQNNQEDKIKKEEKSDPDN
jgi:peroxiredoxin